MVKYLIKLGALSFSDVHLIHRNTPTEDIIERINKVIFNPVLMSSVNVIYIVGDLFEGLATLPDDRVSPVQHWMISLLRFCKNRGIVLRVLEGTPSHDAKQSKQFEILNSLIGINADVRHVTEVEIEYIESLSIHVLYVPDEIDDTTAITKAKVKALLHSKGLKQVDFTLIHGFFEFQIPAHITSNVHDSKYYSKITKYYVLCGHDHVSKKYNNILINGSFDRLKHGEEHDKGCWIINILGKTHTVKFYTNVDATKYITVDSVPLTEMELINIIDKLISSDVRNIRVLVDKNSSKLNIMTGYKNKYKGIKWTIDGSTVKTISDNVITIYKPVDISKNTISEAVKNKLKSMGVDDNTVGNAIALLEKLTTDSK